MDSAKDHFTYPWVVNSTVHVQLGEARSKTKIEKTLMCDLLLQQLFPAVHYCFTDFA